MNICCLESNVDGSSSQICGDIAELALLQLRLPEDRIRVLQYTLVGSEFARF